jgi:Drosophila Retinin like protein
MFKLVVLSCLVSVALAGLVSHPVSYAQVKTIVEPQYSVVETPTVHQVASVVKSIPTAHSYQSQTQYHSKSIVEPIYAHGVEKHVV